MKKKILIWSVGIGIILSGFFGIMNGGMAVFAGDEEFLDLEENPENDAKNEDVEIIEDSENEEVDKLPKLYIKAINPGYKINGVSNVGEMIEIAREESDESISLAGATVGYTNSSGKSSVLFEFPENSWMTSESLLLRLASSPMSELANTSYKKTLAFKGGLTLAIDGEEVDKVCWTGKNNCYKEFKSSSPTTLVRNLETGEFEHLETYQPSYDPEGYLVKTNSEEEKNVVSQCRGLEFSEVLSYYETAKSEQFIELYNAKPERVLLDGCKLRYKNKTYSLEGQLEPEGYSVYYPTGFSLTKNPTNSNTVELIDTDEQILDKMEYPNGQRKGAAYAFLGNDKEGQEIWRVTYAPTPGAPNNYQEFKSCEKGKVINKVTGNCVKVTSIKDKICGEGQYLNVLTGRCKKIETNKEKVCKEGYYLNPETNRCRKIKENNGADYNLQPENYEESSSFIALFAVLGVVGVGLVYLIYEFRKEILGFFGKVFRRFR